MVKTLSRLDILLSGNDGKFAIDEYLRLRDAGEPIPDELRRFIDEAFRRHQNGESLDKAFGLTRRGRRPGSEKLDEAQQVEAALRYIELVDTGESRPNALCDIAIEYDISEDTASKYINRYVDLMRHMLEVKAQCETLIARTKVRSAPAK